jgi:hypothetical protein
MNTHDIMMSDNKSEELKNKGFVFVDEMFKTNGWMNQKNELNWIHYTKPGDETSYFNINISVDKITVSVPIKNSSYQFVTSFKSYHEASEYIEQKFFEYIK